jgi:hypothetical protein
MGRELKISDTLLLKVHYENEEFVEDKDVAYDILSLVIHDEAYDAFTQGYLMRELEAMDEVMGGKELMDEFEDFLKRVKK